MHPNNTHTIYTDLIDARWPQPAAELFARNFPTLDPIFTPVVLRWCEDRTVLELTVCGCSLTQIMQARGEHFWVCIRNMNAIYVNTSLSEEQQHALMQHLCMPPVRE